MHLVFRHSFYRVITASRLLNSIGSYLYNLVFVIYATTLPEANWAVFLANMTAIVPTIFTFWVGVKADETRQKAKWMINLGWVQAGLFTLIAVMIGNKTFLVFSVVCILNFLSDLISDYIAGLRLPIMQYNLAKEDLFEAYSFAQFSTYLANILGQGLGIYLLTLSDNNFTFVAFINAVSFALSSLLLWRNKEKLTHQTVISNSKKQSLFQQFGEMYKQMEDIFRKHSTSNFAYLLLSILILNALGGSVSSIYHFYFMEHTLFNLTYGESLLVMELILLLGAIIGSLTPHDFFSKQEFSFILQFNASLFIVVGLLNVLGLAIWLGFPFLFGAAYLMGKLTPKLDALMMEHLPSETLAQSDHFIGLLFTLSLPIGTFFFSTLAVYSSALTWICFSLAAVVIFFFSFKK
ncbi:transporter [Streptococcus sp. 121]|uniref:transporter n=1 Tax=Streptococcus sp. 121 TaxID=2797637 RepID=UPI0018F0E7CF|nr:transporter [Streptococcus sp. 121]MBJ6745126.1 transporter [Streptococcus sp. 121]